MNNKTRFLWSGLMVLGLLVSGCGGPKSNPSAPNKETPSSVASSESAPALSSGSARVPAASPETGDWLILRLQAEPDTLNPIVATDAYEREANLYVMEQLVAQNPRTLQYDPMLAESWEETEDHLSYTFHLRKDVKWHNGQSFTADDVIYSYNTIMNPQVRCAHIRNYFNDVEKLEKLDDYTIRFVMANPFYTAFESVGGMPIVAKSVFDTGEDFNTHPAGRAPVGTGAYRFVEWKTNQEIVIERNPDWWGYREGKPGYVDRIVYRIASDPTSALQQLQAGQLDMMTRFQQIQWVKQLAAPAFTEKFNKFEFYVPSYSYIGWNSLKPYFSDKRVRRAMTQLIDRQAFIDKVLYGLGQVVTGNLFFQSPYYDSSIQPWPYDPEAARKLLDESGWIDHDGDGIRDKDGVKFEFTFLVPVDSRNAEKIANLLREELIKQGIRMEIKKLEWATFIQDVQAKNFDVVTLQWSMPWSVDLYQLWHSSSAGSNGSNYVSFINEEADEIIVKLRRTFDEEERIRLCHRFHAIVHEEQPYTFMYCGTELMAVDKRFQDVETFRIRPGYDCTEWWVPKAMVRYP